MGNFMNNRSQYLSSRKAGGAPPMPPDKGVKKMRIKVEYNIAKQTEWLCGPFIFYKDNNGVIRNLEAKW